MKWGLVLLAAGYTTAVTLGILFAVLVERVVP